MNGITIASLLKANAGLLALVNTDNIFPYVANEGTSLPLIVYTIDSLAPEYTKDGWAGDTCNFSVVSFSQDYANLQLLAVQVRASLELKHGGDTQRIILTGQQEGYNIQDDIFLNKQTFRVKTINKTI